MDFEKELKALVNLEDINLNEDVVLKGDQKAKDVFCEFWPAAKKALEAIKEMVKNPFIKIVIGIIIKVGDAIYEKKCGA